MTEQSILFFIGFIYGFLVGYTLAKMEND